MTKEELKNRKIALYIKDLAENRELNELCLRAIVIDYLIHHKNVLSFYNLEQTMKDNGIEVPQTL